MSLLQRTADTLSIIDTLYRFAAGLDTRSPTLLASSLAPNAISDFGHAAAKAGFEYPPIHGRDAIIAAVTMSIASLDTTHSVSNPRVTLDGDKAHLDALVEAMHVMRSDVARMYLMKNRYSVELVREGDRWVIVSTTVDNVWRSGDVGVMAVV